MSGNQVRTRLRRLTPAVVARLPMPSARHRLRGRLLTAGVGAAVVAMLALVIFIGAGIVGTPWYHFVRIEGGSMEPTISRGDLIVVAPAPSNVEPGMILVMTVDGEVVTHRVVAVSADGTLTTRGDANTVNDALGRQPAIVDGLYVGSIAWLGRILPVGVASQASFVDRAGAAMQITVGPWLPPVMPPAPVSADLASPAPTEPLAPTAAPVDGTPEPTLDPAFTPGQSPSPDPTSTPAASP